MRSLRFSCCAFRKSYPDVVLSQNHVRTTRREKSSPPGRWRWEGRPLSCVLANRETALTSLIRQRHLTPSCGGHPPTAERTVGPARMIVESLTPRPGIRERHENAPVIG